jgi:hypothetical protein
MEMKKNKRGRKNLGGIRVILRLTPREVEILAEGQKMTKLTRTQMIREAIAGYWTDRRRVTSWRQPAKQ